ncbi:hypothetical protein AGDE_12861 [Angomonas deanei]|nr:hypothetical protein AGDE_12861 [Angomonas deanei]|eukprot:EPY23465.1 hypothetical protein AGDE_12861 [Angomonas deanei]
MAVVGVKDEMLGEKVVAIVALQPDAAAKWNVKFEGAQKVCETEALDKELKAVAMEVLAPYKCPARYLIVPEIPRNPTGKVNKKSLKKALGL